MTQAAKISRRHLITSIKDMKEGEEKYTPAKSVIILENHQMYIISSNICCPSIESLRINTDFANEPPVRIIKREEGIEVFLPIDSAFWIRSHLPISEPTLPVIKITDLEE